MGFSEHSPLLLQGPPSPDNNSLNTLPGSPSEASPFVRPGCVSVIISQFRDRERGAVESQDENPGGRNDSAGLFNLFPKGFPFSKFTRFHPSSSSPDLVSPAAMAEKVTMMIIKVDLQCPHCFEKIQKILRQLRWIREWLYNEKQNIVLITAVCCSPEMIREKIICKGGETVQGVEIVPSKPKKPKEPEEKPEEPNEPEKLKEPEKKPAKTPKEPEKKLKKPMEPEKRKVVIAEPPKEPAKPPEKRKVVIVGRPKEPAGPAKPPKDKSKVVTIEPPKEPAKPPEKPKVTVMLVRMDLQRSHCYEKIEKILSELPRIREPLDDEKNEVLITVVSCSPEEIRDEIICKGGKTVQGVEILPYKPNEPEKKLEKPKEEKLKEPEKKPAKTPKEPEKKPKKPKEPEKKPEEPKEPKRNPRSPRKLRNQRSPRRPWR